MYIDCGAAMKGINKFIIDYGLWLFLLALAWLILSACGVVTPMPQQSASVTMETYINSKPAPIAEPTDFPRQTRVCNSGGLNVRSAAGTGNEVVSEPLKDGIIVTLTGRQETPQNGVFLWYQIESEEFIGWVNSRYLCEP